MPETGKKIKSKVVMVTRKANSGEIPESDSNNRPSKRKLDAASAQQPLPLQTKSRKTASQKAKKPKRAN